MKAGIYVYAWDLPDEGLDNVLAWARDSGITHLHISSNYHAGWFLHPHNPRHKTFYAPDGRLFFHPTANYWKNSGYKPQVAPQFQEIDWLRRAGDKVADYGLKITTWTICGHDTPFGLAHPEWTVHNAFGDSYPHAPCLAHGQAREYHRALVADLSHSLPLEGIQIESCRYGSWKHGHHHERDNTGLSDAETLLMGQCFNPATVAALEARDFDALALKAKVKSLLEAAFDAAPLRPKGHPTTKAELMEILPELAAYEATQREIEASLIAEMRAAMQPDVALYQMGVFTPALEGAVQGFNTNLSGQPPEKVLEGVRVQRAQVPASQALFCGLSLVSKMIPDPQMLVPVVEAVKQGGAERVVFWNCSEAPRTLLDALQPALAGQVETGGSL